ncbi:hypothetical protein KR038_005877 [Drosophila bunnanda]|nr:hypothetical protein KR038_005877 [Drosophila bunnanda]
MIVIHFWWTLLVLFGPATALETKDTRQQLKQGSKTNDFSQMPVQNSQLTAEKEKLTRLKEVDDTTQIRSENQREEYSYNKKDGETVDQDNTSMKCPANQNDPEDNFEFYKMELSDRFHKVLSGRLPEELTDIVFELIHNDTEFEQVLSLLERNLKARNEKLRLQAEKDGDYCEIMTKQKCCRDNNPLVPRLQEFYDIILKTAGEEQKIRENRQNSLWILAENYTNKTSQQQNLTIWNKLAD